MKSKEEIAQWVIDNRYPKNEQTKITDFEMYHAIVDMISEIVGETTGENEAEIKFLEWADLNTKNFQFGSYEYNGRSYTPRELHKIYKQFK